MNYLYMVKVNPIVNPSEKLRLRNISYFIVLMRKN